MNCTNGYHVFIMVVCLGVGFFMGFTVTALCFFSAVDKRKQPSTLVPVPLVKPIRPVVVHRNSQTIH